MCLSLDKDDLAISKKRKIRFRKNRDGMIIAYKGITHQNQSAFKRLQCFKGNLWKVGVMQSSRDKTDLTTDELYEKRVYEGYHFCARVADIKWEWGADKVIRVLVDPKDVVAIGAFHSLLSLVSTKCLVESMEPVETLTKTSRFGRIM